MKLVSDLVGSIMGWIYNFLQANFTEPSNISFYAISVILMTLLISLITIPMSRGQQKQAEKSAILKPKMDEIQKKYSYDPQIYQRKMQELYKEEGVNPGFSSCIVMIFQLVILIALNNVIRDPATYMFKNAAVTFNDNFFWVKTLAEKDPLFYGLPLLTSLSQFGVQLFTMKTNPQMNDKNGPMGSMNTMMLMMPLIYFFMFRGLPAGLPLYWTTSSIARFIILLVTYLIGKAKSGEYYEENSNKNSKK